MAKYMVDEDLAIDSFRNVSKDKIMEFAMKANGESQKEAIEAYKKIDDDLSEDFRKANTAEERKRITEQRIIVADRISAKDTENKEFIIIMSALVVALGAAILVVNVKGIKIPTLKK